MTVRLLRRGTPDVAAIALLEVGGGTEFSDPAERAETCIIVANSWETPVSEDLAPDMLDAPTGDIDVVQDLSDIVMAGFKFIRDVATIPINEADDALVDKLIARARRDETCRPLRRVP